ncbi:CHAT domain-containing protein [Agrobacterium sp. S2/73]|uniref:CHAT domain-containing protein n=1 Tax=unclassified Agrobacterium TaxID=2632611 RepID=UPI001ADC1427|nr:MULTISPECIES: CHAT domain-containing protein [unclassified Agrobacterium]MBO9111943.1 CHAT domain-containing protein [Agrobacterium sp. S2/73]QXZ76303.1 CHAT domain-containing protein [Agrobacterium sp. S7/73]
MSDPTGREPNYGEPDITLPDTDWQYLVDAFNGRYENSLISLVINFSGGVAEVKGEIASEKAKAHLLDLVSRHPKVQRVNEELVVKAPFRSAERDPNDAAFERLQSAVAFDGGDVPITLLRYPHVSIAGELRVGEDVVIAVYLNEEPDEFTAEEPTQITNVSANWSKFSVDVLIHSAELVLDDEDDIASVKLRRGKGCQPALIRAKVADSATKTGSVQLNIQLLYQKRQCGFARRTFQLATTEREWTAPTAPATSDDPAEALNFSAPSSIDSAAEASTLVVAIFRQSNADAGSYTWVTMSGIQGVGRQVTSDHFNIGDARSFAEKLLHTCPTLRPGDHGRVMQGIGEKVWGATPPNFRKHYLDLVKEHGCDFPIQFFTDERFVPWEIMCPEVNDIPGEHLFITHPIARWPQTYKSSPASVFADGDVVSFVPSYGPRDLPFARKELQWLCENVSAIEQNATRAGLLALLETPPETKIRLVHFAGHGACAKSESSALLEMSDGEKVTLEEIDQGRVKLGQRDRSLVVLNACEMGTEIVELNMPTGWATALTARGFGGVLTPLWRVADQHASNLVTDTIEQFLLKGETIAEALRKSRAASKNSSSTPFAYVLYGDVMARASKDTLRRTTP